LTRFDKFEKVKQSTLDFSRFALIAAVLGLASCASKTVAVQHSTPLYSVAPLRQTTNAVDAGDGDLEIASLRKNVSSHPDDVDVRLRLAQAYAARGFTDVALEHLRLASERFPNSLRAAVGLVQALQRAGQNEEALTGLKAFLHRNPQQTALPYEWLGILNDNLENWKDSQAAYETALLYSPDSAELHNNLGYALMMEALKDGAVAEFRTALRLQPNLAIARNNLGIALAGNPKEAILNWQAMSGPAAAHNNMAALLIERGDYKGARRELQAALGYDPHNGQAIFNLAVVSERDGKPAVLPPAPMKTSANPSLWSKILHPRRHNAPGKQTDSASLPAGPSAERAAVPTGSAVGN
jgi:Flp pilus assembly protein TadD